MKLLTVLKLGTECVDKATGLKGTLTHWAVDMGCRVRYLFQPRGLDDEGQPTGRLVLEEERLEVLSKDDFEEVEVPFEILGTIVTDKASGFTGMAIDFIRHINGCFHVSIQPKGILKKNGNPIQKSDFDLRQCTGKKIKELSEAELKESKNKNPSPAPYTTENIFQRKRFPF